MQPNAKVSGVRADRLQVAKMARPLHRLVRPQNNVLLVRCAVTVFFSVIWNGICVPYEGNLPFK